MNHEKQEISYTTRWGARYTQVTLMFLGMIIAYALRVNLSVAIIAMTDQSSNEKYVLDWNEQTKSVILTSFFWGYFMTQVFAGHMAQKYGAKYFLAAAITVNGILAIGIPVSAIYGGKIAMCANRVVQGMAQGFLYPSINVLLSKWAPLEEKSRLFSFVFGGIQFGPLVILPVAGILAETTAGWPSIFYVTGALSIVWVLIWCLFGANSPSEHKTISEEEKQYIINSLSSTTSAQKLPTPWVQIVKSIPMWAILIAHLSQNWGFWVLLTYMPSYLSYVLKFNIKSNGFLSALPYMTMWLMTLVISWISDFINKKQYLTTTYQRKMWNSLAHWGGALALFSLYFLNTSVVGAIVLLTTALTLNSGVLTGFLSNHLDLAPNFAGTLMGITNSLANITSIMGPLIVGFIVTDNTNKDQWGIVFLIAAGVFFFGNLFYIIFGSAKIQTWNNSSIEQKKESNSEGI
ncbi:putative inorganic phosphate cotransporter isoform X2 [Daktulosphaira vitifoliae]|uniref:putative inorganic phosphate cotransporter isoform X2 n=1 Tax=Daktulosphaira vitifoliae TaxID=58002 RepID=UPI0021A98A0D|nr:putative inorganic phosphate cotransporter isoform X2 [Daktulosphaira vitifoliae]